MLGRTHSESGAIPEKLWRAKEPLGVHNRERGSWGEEYLCGSDHRGDEFEVWGGGEWAAVRPQGLKPRSSFALFGPAKAVPSRDARG